MTLPAICERSWEGYVNMYGLIDTDVLYKLSIYDFFPALLSSPPPYMGDPAILAASQFVAAKKIQKKLPQYSGAILRSLRAVVEQLAILEPTEEETKVAENLERAAAQLSLNLDSGESQLCAMVLCRKLNGIFTGDKRAAIAIEKLNSLEPISGKLEQKITCLEQLILWITAHIDPEEIRNAICRHTGADRSLESCFSCTARSFFAESAHEGLRSYINALVREAPTVISRLSQVDENTQR
jgi:hypothetical protein